MGQDVGDGPADTLLEAHRSLETRDRLFEFAVVEQDRIGLVTGESAAEIIGAGRIQELLAGDLVPGILPIRVCERGSPGSGA